MNGNNDMMTIRYLLLVLITWITAVQAIGMIIPPLKHQTKFTSSSTLSNHLIQYKDDMSKYRQTIEEYVYDIPCLRHEIIADGERLFVIIRLKFNNIGENSYNSKGLKNQYLNMNIVHTNVEDINIIRNKKDITEENMRIGFEVPVSRRSNDELYICFENVLIDRSKFLKSFKTDERDDLITREVELDISTFANFDEFQKLYNNYGNDLVKDFEESQVELDKIEEIVLSISNDLQGMMGDESVKRDLNEQIFRNALVFQLPLMVTILFCNVFYIYKFIRQLQLKKIIA